MFISPHTRYRAPTVPQLADWLSHEHGDNAKKVATTIRDLWKTRDPEAVPSHIFNAFTRAHTLPHQHNVDDLKFWYIDSITKCTHGVEFLGTTRKGDDVHYCNAGDAYAETLCFIGGTLKLSACSDITERPGFRPFER